jgi:hypothetical protein
MGHPRHDADKIETLRTRMQLISKDSQANMLMILVPAVVCWIHAQKQKISLAAASKPGQVGTAALLGEQQRVLHHLLRVASRLELSAQTVLVSGARLAMTTTTHNPNATISLRPMIPAI